MKCIGFVGKTNKLEIAEYIGKIINTLGNKVILVDATTAQKSRYSVPIILGTGSQSQYVVQYDNIDVAVGFSNMLELKKYLLSKGEDFNEYDYVLVDTDSEEMIEEYDLKSANTLFFVSSYDKYDVVKGVELLKYVCAAKRRADPEGRLDIDKMIYYSEVNSADAGYIDALTENLPINWISVHKFPYDQGDLSANIQNQYAGKMDFKYLTKNYKEALITSTRVITGADDASIRKVVKTIEKNAKFSL